MTTYYALCLPFGNIRLRAHIDHGNMMSCHPVTRATTTLPCPEPGQFLPRTSDVCTTDKGRVGRGSRTGIHRCGNREADACESSHAACGMGEVIPRLGKAPRRKVVEKGTTWLQCQKERRRWRCRQKGHHGDRVQETWSKTNATDPRRSLFSRFVVEQLLNCTTIGRANT